MRKEFNLNEEEIDILKSIMKEKRFDKEVEAVRFLIHGYSNRKMEDQLVEANQQLKILEKIVKGIEVDNTLMKDAINTFLISSNMQTCIPASLSESPVYTKSKEYQKQQAIKNKQRKDYRSKN